MARSSGYSTLGNPTFTPKFFDPHLSLIVSIFSQSVSPSVGPATISPVQTKLITIKPLNLFFRQENKREMTPPQGLSTLTPIPGPNTNKLPPITTSTFTARSPVNKPLAYRASTSANPDPMINPAFIEANYEILESFLKERRRQIRNEDLRTELEYFSEDLRGFEDRERVVEFESALNKDGGRVEWNSEGGRPLERRGEDNMHHGVNLSPLLAAHLGRSENGQLIQSSLTSVHGGH
ncbi:hypothetical protein Tco_1050480 [Tanacetum coccineum]